MRLPYPVLPDYRLDDVRSDEAVFLFRVNDSIVRISQFLKKLQGILRSFLGNSATQWQSVMEF